MELSDEVLLIQYAEASLPAFHTLFTRHSVDLYSYVLSLVKNRSVADDITQMIWEKVIKKAGEFADKVRDSDSEFVFRAYLFTMAKNAATDHFRSSHEKYTSDHSDGDAIDSEIELIPGSTADEAESVLALTDLLSCVESHLKDFSTDFVETFRITRDGFLSYIDAANALSISVETVRSRVKTVLSRVKPCLEAHQRG